MVDGTPPSKGSDAVFTLVALQLLGFIAALQVSLVTAPIVVHDAFVALTFTSTFAEERPADAGKILTDVNAARRASGVAPLELDERLCGVARGHARDMLERGYVSHTTPEGVTPYDRMRDIGYAFVYAGENIALNLDRASAERALMASASHRRNILDPHYSHVGIAAIATDGAELMIVEEFAD